MKKITLTTALGLVAIILCAIIFLKYRYSSNPIVSVKETEEALESPSQGYQEYVKYHLSIRTRVDEVVPSYEPNYQSTELGKALHNLAIAKKTSGFARTADDGNGVIRYTDRGPGNVPGRTRGLIVDPDDPTHKTWYAGSASGGIWKTANGGADWRWLTTDVPNLQTTTLVMAESNHNIIYAGMGESFSSLVIAISIAPHGVLKSIDRGETWKLINNTSNFGPINRLIVDPTNENVVLAASTLGIFRSTDGGSNWIKVLNGRIEDLHSTPGNFSILYATYNGLGVFKSVDAGITWTKSSKGMVTNGRIEIDISPVDPNRLAASVEGNSSGVHSDLFVSDDAGANWKLVSLILAGKTLDYLGFQGSYNNTISFSPYNKDVVYVGGQGLYQVTFGSPTTGSFVYSINENNTAPFVNLLDFGGNSYGGKLDVNNSAVQDSVEIRFGPGLSQKTHRFLVPIGATSNVPASNYSYQDYIDVPFQVWNKKTNTQLMASFRDQGRDGKFNLIEENFSGSDVSQSREYFFINNVAYNAVSPSSSIVTNGGHMFNLMYFIWPVLPSGASWNPSQLPSSSLQIVYKKTDKYSSTVVSAVDNFEIYDAKNIGLVHPDYHNIVPIKQNDASKTYQLLVANDGGVYLSGISTNPGTAQGEWAMVGNGYNTTQFYGVDKRPGAQEYIGGAQDNGTNFSPSGEQSSSKTRYEFAFAGDGGAALWHSADPKKMIGSTQFNNFRRSLDGGATWSKAVSGLRLLNGVPDASKYPFFSRLAYSKQNPDVIFSVGTEGVWKSTNFGGSWALSPIGTGWYIGGSSPMVAVSRANSNIIWGGAAVGPTSDLFVSTDQGNTFKAVSKPTGFSLGNITGIATHPTEGQTAYVLFSFAKTAKILMTKDLGKTWTDISGFGSGTSSNNGFPDVATFCLYVRSDNPNVIWAGTEIGIVQSLDAGNSWQLLAEFPHVIVFEMIGQDDEIVIATHGRGIWTATVPTTQNPDLITEVKTDYTSSLTAFPNPSPTGKFYLQFSLPKSSNVSLHVSDMTGKTALVKNLGFLQPGEHQIELSLESNEGGIYVARLTTSSGEKMIKLLRSPD
jgi:photosystem II stability/assembly factor-like uncharacterized protein